MASARFFSGGDLGKADFSRKAAASGLEEPQISERGAWPPSADRWPGRPRKVLLPNLNTLASVNIGSPTRSQLRHFAFSKAAEAQGGLLVNWPKDETFVFLCHLGDCYE